MKLEINLKLLLYEDKSILWNLLQLYKYDFSEYDTKDIDSNGMYDYRYFEDYWIDKDRFPFIIYVNGHIAGFVLVNGVSHFKGKTGVYSMAEFFVMRKYRGKGVGKFAAFYILDRFKGEWEVAQDIRNKPSLIFWDKIISIYSDNKYDTYMEEEADKRVLVFQNS